MANMTNIYILAPDHISETVERFFFSSDLIRQDRKKKRIAKCLCDEHDRAIICVFCRDLELI